MESKSSYLASIIFFLFKLLFSSALILQKFYF
jgi:hypothetical protein